MQDRAGRRIGHPGGLNAWRVDFQSSGSPQASSYTLPRTKGLVSVGLRRTKGPGSAATAWVTRCSSRRDQVVLTHTQSRLPPRLSDRLAVFLLLRLHQAKPGFQFAAATFQAAGNLGKQIVTILDAGSYISRGVLQFALALEIKGIEQHLRHGFRVLLSQEPTGECLGYSLIREQFLQINSNQQAAFRCESKGCSRNRDSRCVFFFRSWFLFGLNLLSDWSRNWTASTKDFGPENVVSSKNF